MQHGCHTIKNSQKKGDWQNFNVFKMQQGSAKRNSSLNTFCPIPQGFPGEERQQPEGPHPLLHPTGASITRPAIRHHQSHRRRSSRPPLRQQRPESPAGSRGCGHHTSGETGLQEGRASSPSGWQKTAPGRVQGFGCEKAKTSRSCWR